MILEAKNLQCLRGHRQLFNGLNVRLTSGDILLVEGNNGSGKSTLLKILSGLRVPDQGEVCWHGKPLAIAGNEYSKQMVWLSHRNGINESMTAKENVQIMSSLTNSYGANIGDVLDRVGLRGHANTPVRQFSAGMKRRLALTRLLTKKAKLWILDEPQGALDKAGIDLLETLVKNQATCGGIVIMSSHHDVSFDDASVKTLTLSGL